MVELMEYKREIINNILDTNILTKLQETGELNIGEIDYDLTIFMECLEFITGEEYSFFKLKNKTVIKKWYN